MNEKSRKFGAFDRVKGKLELAFTLIELLVVIAIIAILAGMLLPALANAKNKTIQVIDLNNFKQLTYATTMYANDNRDSLPAPGWGTTANSWCYGKNISGNFGQQQTNYLMKGELWPFIKVTKIYFCPIDKTNDSNFTQRNIKCTSYVMNGSTCNFGGLNDGLAYKSGQFRPDAFQFWETDETQPFYFNDSSSYPDEGISQRHIKGATIAAFGSTTQSIKFSLYYSNQYAGVEGSRGAGIPKNTLPNLIWNSPGDAHGL